MGNLEWLKNYFEKIPEVSFAFLFGSRSKGLERDVSDYDVAVYFKPENERIIEFEEGRVYPLSDKIWTDLDSFLKQEIDLLTLNNAPTHLAAEIITKGTPIIIKDKNLFLKFMLFVSSDAIDFRELAKEYYEIFEKSKSLSEEERLNLRRRLTFIESEIKDYEKFKKISWQNYLNDRDLRKIVERWVENIINAIIDMAKILLSSNKIPIPESYKDIILKLAALQITNYKDIEKLAGWVRLRNILAHEYLDIQWERIKNFIHHSEAIVKSFTESIKKIV